MNKLKQLLTKLYIKYMLKKHKYPASTLIHRKHAKVIFEIEFNWYDENFEPVSVVREVLSNKIFSIRSDEMKEFVEYTGSDPNAGAAI